MRIGLFDANLAAYLVLDEKQQAAAILPHFAGAKVKMVLFEEINVFNTQTYPFHEAQAITIERLGHKSMGPLHYAQAMTG